MAQTLTNFDKLGLKSDVVFGEQMSKQNLLLPMNHILSNDQVEYTCEMIKKFYRWDVQMKNISVSGGLRTDHEAAEGRRNKDIFDSNPSSWETKLENFPKYVRRQNLTRFLALYEIFKKIE